MNNSAFISLVYNAALLLVLVFLYDLIARYLRQRSWGFKVLTGLLLGAISIAVMLAAWHLYSGVMFDTRSVVLSMGTLFYGTVPGLIAGVIAAAYRASQGGSGAVMGVSVIAMSVVVGALWRRWRHVARRDPSILELYLFGLTVHVCMLALTATLPDPLATLRQIAVPVIVIYPLASVLLGLVMIDQRRRRRTLTTLRESEQRYRSLFEDSPVAMWEEDDSAVKAYLEELVAEGVDDVLGFLLTHPEEYARCVALARTLDANKAAVRLFEAGTREELLARNSDLYRRETDRGIYHFWAAMLSGERSATFEEANLSLKGRELHVLETCTVVPGHESTFDRVYIADVDISERRRAEEERAESHDLLANLARLVPGVVYQYRLCPDGSSSFPYSSPGMVDIYEVTPEEVREDATAVFGRLHPDDLDRVSETILESARTLETFLCEFRVVLPEQGPRWRWSQAHPERTADGGTLWHGIISDVTPQKEAEQEIRRQAEQLRRTVEGSVLAMGHIVEMRDPYTAGHQRRVAELAVAIAAEIGASEAELEGLRLAALIHDIGKLVVPAEILTKPGRLSEDEFALIKEHSQAGHDVICQVEFELPVADIVLQHHERLDGTGYPQGLAGDEILPGGPGHRGRRRLRGDDLPSALPARPVARECHRRAARGRGRPLRSRGRRRLPGAPREGLCLLRRRRAWIATALAVQCLDGLSRRAMPSSFEDPPGMPPEDLYRSILRASPDDITVTDLEGRILLVSPAAVSMLGHEREEEMLGRPMLDYLAPEDRQRAEASIGLMFDGVYTGPAEYTAVRTDETRFPIEVNGEFTRDALGRPTGMVFIVRDVTQRKLAEQALRASEERFRVLFEDHRAVMLLVEPDSGQILDVNEAAARFYGYSREQLRAMRIDQINQLPPEEVAAGRRRAVGQKAGTVHLSASAGQRRGAHRGGVLHAGDDRRPADALLHHPRRDGAQAG